MWLLGPAMGVASSWPAVRPPPGAPDQAQLERSDHGLQALESLTLTLVPLMSKLLRMQETGLRPEEFMVQGVQSKLVALKSCWTNTLVYEPHASSLYGFCPLHRKSRPLVKNSLHKTYSAPTSVVLSPSLLSEGSFNLCINSRLTPPPPPSPSPHPRHLYLELGMERSG